MLVTGLSRTKALDQVFVAGPGGGPDEVAARRVTGITGNSLFLSNLDDPFAKEAL
jgi:hypothetical protein